MSRWLNALYNLDRAVASFFGADPQATISSEVGRKSANPARDKWDFYHWLIDRLFSTPTHCEDAAERAERLRQAEERESLRETKRRLRLRRP